MIRVARSPRAGYSLFEVLIAFAILALVLAALIPGQARLLARAATSETRLLAADYAASRLDRLGVSEPLAPGRREEDYRDWHVTLDVAEERIGNGALKVFRVIVEVRANPEAAPLARLETLRPAP